MSLSTTELWIMIAALGLGTFLLRFSFLALLGNRELPDGLLRLLRYTPVAVIPGLMAPQMPVAGATGPDPIKLAAAVVTVMVGVWSKNVIGAMIAGVAVLSLLTWLAG